MLVNGNALQIPLEDQSVQCCVTSPPYWGLRDYGTAEWVGGDPDCEHLSAKEKSRYDYSMPESAQCGTHKGMKEGTDAPRWKNICPDCGAVKIDNQLGLEQTPEEYVENMVAVFREVWRVLRDDGTLWLNLGDSYAGSGKGPSKSISKEYQEMEEAHSGIVPVGLKQKDLVGIPWRVALALQADGWYLRNDIIWHKPNPMPESVQDRCTKSHEYIFLLTKNPRYFYDNDAIRVPLKDFPRTLRGVNVNKNTKGSPGQTPHTITQPRKNIRKEFESTQGGGGTSFVGHSGYYKENGELICDPKKGANKKTVWTVSTKSYHGAHYATFPPDLIDDCIKAGTSEKGKCPNCGTPWKRVKEVVSRPDREAQEIRANMVGVIPGRDKECRMNSKDMASIVYKDAGWEAGCECGLEPGMCVVLDPFVGSGTTCMVARDLGRFAVGLDLSLDYLLDNARPRLEFDKLENWIDGNGQETDPEKTYHELPLFKENNVQ